MENDKKECRAYFLERSVYKKLFAKIQEKYAGIGHFGGTFLLDDLTKEEKEQLGGFLQKDFSGQKNVRVTAKQMEKALQSSRFCNFTWEEILELYTGRALLVKKEEKQKEEGIKQIAVLNPQLYVELAGKNYDKVDGGYFTTNNANGEKIIVALRVVSKIMYLIGFREAASNNALYCDQSMTVKFNTQGDIVDFGNRPIMFLPDNGKLNISYVYTGDLSINDYKLDINADYVDQLMKNSKKAFIKSKIFK